MDLVKSVTVDGSGTAHYLAPGKWKLSATIPNGSTTTITYWQSRQSTGPFTAIAQNGAAIESDMNGGSFVFESCGEHVRAEVADSDAASVSAHAIPVPS
jgi:hypothetical protein